MARRKVATLAQQLEKLRWEDKGDQERLKLNRRKKNEIVVSIKLKLGFEAKNVSAVLSGLTVCINAFSALV